MKKILQKSKSIISNNNGISGLISSLCGLFAITIMLVISISFIRVVYQQSVLNEFANQMVITVCEYGKTSGDEIDVRYEQLENSLKLSPTITYDTTYFSGDTVQYGDTIKLSANIQISLDILGYNYDYDLTITKTGVSEQYYK